MDELLSFKGYLYSLADFNQGVINNSPDPESSRWNERKLLADSQRELGHMINLKAEHEELSWREIEEMLGKKAKK